jgi:hypothetical protein
LGDAINWAFITTTTYASSKMQNAMRPPAIFLAGVGIGDALGNQHQGGCKWSAGKF